MKLQLIISSNYNSTWIIEGLYPIEVSNSSQIKVLIIRRLLIGMTFENLFLELGRSPHNKIRSEAK